MIQKNDICVLSLSFFKEFIVKKNTQEKSIFNKDVFVNPINFTNKLKLKNRSMIIHRAIRINCTFKVIDI